MLADEAESASYTGNAAKAAGLAASDDQMNEVGPDPVAQGMQLVQVAVRRIQETEEINRASCERRVRPSFCLRRRGERGSADGT